MKNVHRKLEELNLLDNFLFGSMVTHPEYGEYFSRSLLQVILNRKFGKLTVIPQKVYYGSDTNLHGAQLDVYLEETEDETTTVYDVEPELKRQSEVLKTLPKRVRFYHAKMDSRSLKSGEKYHALKNVIIIVIMPYDPFGLNRMLYTVKNGCVEEPGMPYEDGALTLFFYTKGKIGIPSEEIRQLLAYMENSSLENATNSFLRELHEMVEHVKHDEEVSVEYMRKMEEEEVLLERGRQLGIEEGILEGIREGKREGIELGKAEGKREGIELGKAEGKMEGIQAFILSCMEDGSSKKSVIEKLIKYFKLSIEEAEEYYQEYILQK